MTHTYSAGNGKVLQSNYGNGNSYTNQYDTLGNVVGVKYNGVQQFTWKMNAKVRRLSTRTCPNEKKYYYEYDSTAELRGLPYSTHRQVREYRSTSISTT